MTSPQDIAVAIVSSEQFLWLMSGSNHTDLQVEALRPAWNEYRQSGGAVWPFRHRLGMPTRGNWTFSRLLAEFESAERDNIRLVTQLAQIADAIRSGASQQRLLQRLDELAVP